MSWAMRRRLMILAVIAVVLALLIALFYFLAVHDAPSCVDNAQNQGEEGVDCGGTCTYLCSASQTNPSTRFVRAFSPLPGRTDVIAYVDNPNPSSAARGVRYHIDLYDPANVIIAKSDGTIDLPPGTSVPVYVANLFSGSAAVGRAFLTIDTSTTSLRWYRAEAARVVPNVRIDLVIEGETPRIQATLTNPAATFLRNVPVVITLFDAAGNAIAASQSVVPELFPLGSAPVVFTWNSAFSAPVSRVDVIPVIPPSGP